MMRTLILAWLALGPLETLDADAPDTARPAPAQRAARPHRR
jgi:hypothetical protein